MSDTEEDDIGFKTFTPGRRDLVIRTQHGNIVGGLIEKDPMLCRGVVGKRIVPVEMVRGDVQTNCNVRPKTLDRLKLKARELGDGPRVVGRRLCQTEQRRTDVATYLSFQPGVFQKLADQSSSRRLSVRSGDTDNTAFHKPVCELDLADHFAVFAIDISRGYRVGRNTG